MKWIKPEDELPEPEVEVLIYVQKFGHSYGYISYGWLESNEWWAYSDCQEPYKHNTNCDHRIITHWMHLPDVPQS